MSHSLYITQDYQISRFKIFIMLEFSSNNHHGRHTTQTKVQQSKILLDEASPEREREREREKWYLKTIKWNYHSLYNIIMLQIYIFVLSLKAS